MEPMNKKTSIILKRLLPFLETAKSGMIGYQYDFKNNQLGLPDSDLAKLATLAISESDADILLRNEYFNISFKFSRKYAWFADLDSVTSFVMIACAKLLTFDKMILNTELIEHIHDGRFNIASLELQRLGIDRQLIMILRSGRLV